MKYTRILIQDTEAPYDSGFSRGMMGLLHGGYVRDIGRGLFAFMPMGLRVVKHIEEIIRDEFQGLDGEEILLPLVTPAGLWSETGRDVVAAEELTYLLDRSDNSLVLAPSHEEALLALIRQVITDPEQLPRFLYQIQLKFRDEDGSHPGSGLVRGREFIMGDGFSIHPSYAGLNNFFPRVFAAFHRIFRRCGIAVFVAEGAANFLGGAGSYEFLMPFRGGEHRVVICQSCHYAANQDVAVGLFKNRTGKLLALEPVDHTGDACLDELHRSLGVPRYRLTRCQVFLTMGGFAMAVLRGDQMVSLDKLSRVLDEPVIREATQDELFELGLKPGYLSPLGLSEEIKTAAGLRTVADSVMADSTNLVIGGNEDGKLWVNSNFGRDYSTDLVGDIARVDESCRCYHCGGELRIEKVTKLAHLIRLGSRFSRRMEFSLPNPRGGLIYPHLGSYGIGIGRLMASIAEANTDTRGLLWPLGIAPFKAYFVVVGRGHTIQQIAGHVYTRVQDVVLYDDRKIPVLKKFKDAQRLGIPILLVLSAASLQDGCVMLGHRRLCPATRVPFHQIPKKIEELTELEEEMRQQHAGEINQRTT